MRQTTENKKTLFLSYFLVLLLFTAWILLEKWKGLEWDREIGHISLRNRKALNYHLYLHRLSYVGEEKGAEVGSREKFSGCLIYNSLTALLEMFPEEF